jgi:hypothetical protein
VAILAALVTITCCCYYEKRQNNEAREGKVGSANSISGFYIQVFIYIYIYIYKLTVFLV